MGRPARGARDLIAFDLLCMLGLGSSAASAALARRDPCVRLDRVSVHAVRVELEHERRAAAGVSHLGLLAAHVPVGARRLRGARGLDEVRGVHRRTDVGDVPAHARQQISGPFRLRRGDARWRSRSSCSSRASATRCACSGTARVSWQLSRDSPFSIWDWRPVPRQGHPEPASPAAVPPGAPRRRRRLLFATFPRRKTPLQLAALTGVLLLGFELVLTHWSYLYIPWFFPFVAYAMLAPPEPEPGAGAPGTDEHRSQSLSPPAELRAVGLTAVALALFVASWIALNHGWFARGQILDTPVYENYGDAMLAATSRTATSRSSIRRARCPCSSCRRWATRGTDGYKRSFQVLMAICGAALLIALAVALSSLGASSAMVLWRAGAGGDRAAAARFGRALAIRSLARCAGRGALAALVSGRLRLGHALLGAGILAKVWPGVLLPLAVAYVWRRAAGARRSSAWASRPRSWRRSSSVRRARAARRVDELRAAAVPAAADREPRRVVDRALAPRLRHRRDDGLEPRLAEHRRHDGERHRLVPDRAAAVRAARVVDHVRASQADARGASSVLRGGGRRVRRAGQGALAAVPDLADPARCARAQSGASWCSSSPRSC